jgi:putative redox protein
MQVRLNWTEGYQFVARAGKSPAIVIDSTDGGSGPTPMELLLMGVAGCTGIDIVSIMKKKRAVLSAFSVNISGEKAEEEPKRFTRIRIEYVLQGKEIKASGVEQAIELSRTKYCSAMASMNAEFQFSYRIIEGAEITR